MASEEKLQIRAEEKLKERIKKGAEKKGFRSMSDYVRNAVLAELIRDGVA
jgi:Arc/MetJ-type ribon-helix-helix transcriptional regulator